MFLLLTFVFGNVNNQHKRSYDGAAILNIRINKIYFIYLKLEG